MYLFAIGLVVNIVISEQRRKKALGDRLRVTKISHKYGPSFPVKKVSKEQKKRAFKFCACYRGAVTD